MNFNNHLHLEGQHAFLSASQHHWVNYDDEKLEQRYRTVRAAQRGTRVHEIASELIEMGIKLPRSKKTLNMYVNDAIGFKMHTEQILYFSDNAFGTTDAIAFRRNLLRIHDLKTGVTPASMRQLEIYTALFCLEYGHQPRDIDIELRLYQSDDILIHLPDPDDILYIMDKMISFDRQIDKIKMEV